LRALDASRGHAHVPSDWVRQLNQTETEMNLHLEYLSPFGLQSPDHRSPAEMLLNCIDL
jgi:hypothetical protein